MLRILAGTLLSTTLLSGPVFASSFLAQAETQERYGPSFLVMADDSEIMPPVDPVVTAAYGDEDEPRVIEAPRMISLSPSISVLLPGAEPETSRSIASVGNEAPEDAPEEPRQLARQSQPMVFRGGIVGDPFVASAPSPIPAPDRAATTPAPSSQPTQASQPSRSASSPPSGPTTPRPAENRPPAPPVGTRM